ncbi:putative TRAP transporter TAXI family solute receptor [Gammaproteobacteria bacterium]
MSNTSKTLTTLLMGMIRYNWWALLIVLVGFLVAYHFVTPPPPREITIATGSEYAGYHRFGRQLKAALEQQGLRVNLRLSAGTIENLNLLSDPNSSVSVAFGQGGAERFYTGDKKSIRGLGSLFYEPFWIFYRKEANMNSFADLKHMKVAIGKDGSGTQVLSKLLLRESHIPETSWVPIGFKEGVPALQRNEVQAIFLVAPVNDVSDPQKPNPDLHALMADPNLSIFPLGRIQAHISRLPHLSTVTINEGLLDLENDYPPTDVTLISPRATLICRDDLNGDIAVLILQTCRKLQEQGGWLEKPNEFPSPKGVTFPLLHEAEQFHEEGPSFFHKVLPFWVANTINRLWIMAIPLVTLAVPLIKLALPAYRWKITRKISAKYRLLMDIDDRIAKGTVINTLDADIEQLIKHENELSKFSVPIMFAGEYYSMRVHVHYLRNRLEEIREKSTEDK